MWLCDYEEHGRIPLNPSILTVADMLKGHGYKTAAIGKAAFCLLLCVEGSIFGYAGIIITYRK